MKYRWWVFQVECYYPAGGLNDVVSVHETEEEAVQAAKEYGRLAWAENVEEWAENEAVRQPRAKK